MLDATTHGVGVDNNVPWILHTMHARCFLGLARMFGATLYMAWVVYTSGAFTSATVYYI